MKTASKSNTPLLERCEDAETQARRDRIAAYLEKQALREAEKRAVDEEQAGTEAAARAERVAARHREEFEQAKSSRAESLRRLEIFRSVDLPAAKAAVARIPKNAGELYERWKIFRADRFRYSEWMQRKQSAPNPGEEHLVVVPPGFVEDPRPAVRLFLEAPAVLRGVQERIAYNESIVKNIERNFPELAETQNG